MDLGAPTTRIEFAAPHRDLRRFVTAYYISEVEGTNGDPVEDLLHPEWSSIRFLCKGKVTGSVLPDPPITMFPVTLTGHTSRAAAISCTSMKIASFGLLPLGWYRFIKKPAHRFSDHSVDAHDVDGRVDFAALLPQVQNASSLAEISALFDECLLAALKSKKRVDVEEEAAIEALHRAIADPDVATVAELTSRLGITTVQLERLSKRVFGFPPKLLLRRQRFLRTLGVVLMQPQSSWSEVLDPQYYDQAHFNRDFRRFFGMSPRQYLAMPKPIVAAAARERMRAIGGALQGLQMPGG
jgi:AraC-like DNA-binding protein